MKIGIDCRLWSETGVGRYIRNLVLNLRKIDKKNEYVLFVLSKDYDQIISHFSSLNFHLVKTDIRWHTLGEQLRFPQILNRENLNLIHFPYYSVPIFYNRPFVITIHDLIVDHFSTGKATTLPLPAYEFKRLAYKFILRLAAKKAKKIIAVSNATKNEIIDHLKIDGEKIVVTYEGVDDKIRNLPTSLKLRGASKIQNYFLYVGNAYPHKNLERLLEAFKALNSDVSLVLIGKEDYFYKRLKNKIQTMGLSDKVTFLRNVGDEELSGLYRNAKALILPSLMEGFGLPALEAMANNCLVLASDIPALKEVCGDTAIYFNPYDINDMVEKMKEIYSNDNSGKKERGSERAKLFSWERMAKETLKVYESCVGL